MQNDNQFRTEGQNGSQPQPQPQAMPQPQPQVASQPQAVQQPQAQAASQTQAVQQPQAQAATQPQAQVQAATQPQVQAVPQQQTPAQAMPQPQPQPRVAAQPQPQVASQPQPQPQPQPAPFAQQPQVEQAPPIRGAYAAAQPVQPTVVQKKSRGWIVAIVFIACMTLITIVCVKSCADAMGSLGHTGGATALSGDTVAVINIDGTIQYDGSECSPEGFKELLDQAADDDHIKAVVLRVNSGGGTATAGEEMTEYLKDFRKTTEKPVVVSSASINASAAYEISAQADFIYVAKSTEIGAIGTAMQVTDLSGLLEMLGVNMDVITSADSKDSSYGYRPLTDEERAYYQDMVNKINQAFIDNVVEGRDMTLDQVKALATGMPFTGIDAVENGLADAVGTREDAMDKAAELAGISSYDTTELYFTNYDLSSLSYLLGSSGDTSVDDLLSALEERNNARTAQ